MSAALPNAVPRPAGEREALEAVWQQPGGWRLLTAVNNTQIGLMYIGTALLFLLLAGVLALVMRTQLAVPGNDLVDAELYNQLFTMHGSVMMFLFAVPVVEAIGVLLLPAMLAARDLPFPRLSAYAFWAYAIGGLAFFATLFTGLAPDGGWFMYPPLTSYEFSPGLRTDFWLLGIGFIEISAIAGAIEIIVGILKTRPPGMTLERMPVYAWAMLVTSWMIVFAFPAVILATILLELERAFHWPFFIAELGGDPLLWQHLFWLFGHPDVYIIFLPAAGLISMLVAGIAQVPLAGYRAVVASLIGTGVIAFTLWVHHMFATGMSHATTNFFSAASMLIAVPAGIQVFCWLATLRRGRVRLSTPAWFMLAFFAVFVLGGLTGVMVAVVPYDWQVHDTYFVVAHLHYVLIGGMVLPVFAAIYYWAPTVSGRVIAGAWGKVACALTFVGINVTFFPLHIVGLLGMPRRVWTYPAGLGWESWNLVATIGAFVLAAGVLLACIDLVVHLRVRGKVDANPWKAGTLEWLPMDNYGVRSIPRVDDRYPLWAHPELRTEVDAGAHYLPGIAIGGRETIVTAPLDARPQYLLRLTGPSWLPLLAGAGTAAFFFALTLKLTVIATASAALTVFWVLRWLWETEPAPTGKLHAIGGGIRLPDRPARYRDSHAWWAVLMLLIVDGVVFACLVFSFVYLWSFAPAWPQALVPPPLAPLAASAAAWLGGSAAIAFAGRLLARRGARSSAFVGALIMAAVLVAAATALHAGALEAGNLQPTQDAYAALVATVFAWQALHVALLAIMWLYVVARAATNRLAPERRTSFDSLRLIWHYSSGQAVLGMLLVQLPR